MPDLRIGFDKDNFITIIILNKGLFYYRTFQEYKYIFKNNRKITPIVDYTNHNVMYVFVYHFDYLRVKR